MNCPKCNGTNVHADRGYNTIQRCFDCGFTFVNTRGNE